jgi:pimeloyl-ACP methyl ester carboxylesterase
MAWHILVTVFWALLLGGIGLYLLGAWLFRARRLPDEIHYAKTRDGWDIAFCRVRPKGGPKRATPVILQHGLGACHRNFDLNDRHSLVHYLAQAGYDCFFPDLRGCGDSAYLKWGHPDRWHIGFGDFIEQDLPAVIDKVLALTGADQVHFIGHSMGGMIGYALAAGPYGAKLRSVTSVAGPAIFKAMGRFKMFTRFKNVLNPFPVLHNDVINCILAPVSYIFPQVARDEVYWPNVERRTLAEGAANIMAPMPRRLLFQFAAWVEFGQWGAHGNANYEKELAKITAPLYGIAGTRDVFCPLGAIEPVFDMVGSKKKRLRVFSLENGDRADYGHGDLVIGRHAPDEIFPTILQWLEENEPPA